MKYNILYVDPPWQYRDKANAGERGACHKYEVMSVDALKQLPIATKLAADDCVLFMWATMPQLPVAIDVMAAWNFTYKTVAFTWVKRNKIKPTGWFLGMGNWTRANPELCLLGVRGKPKRVSASVHSVVEAPVRAHSQKPDEVRDRIIALCGDLPRVELFARSRVAGWNAMGIGVDGKRIEETMRAI